MKVLKMIQYNAPVVLTFALVSLAALVVGTATGGESTHLLFSVYSSPFTEPLTYVRLFGHVLGHANLSHYVNNMMLFLLLGPMVEEKYGSGLLLGMIAVTAVVTGLVNMVFFSTALMGASGIVFMLVILSSMVRLEEGKIPLTMILVVIIYLGQEIYSGLVTQDNVSQLTHVLGGICGGAFGWLLNRRTLKAEQTS